MKLIHLQSSMLSDAGYDAKKHELGAVFKTGGLYIYENVPRVIFTGLMEVHSVGDSVGAYMHKYVIDKFPYRRMNEPGVTSPEKPRHKPARKTTSKAQVSKGQAKGQTSKGNVLQFRQKRNAVQNRER